MKVRVSPYDLLNKKEKKYLCDDIAKQFRIEQQKQMLKCIYLFLIYLHRDEGFGAKRLQRAFHGMEEMLEEYGVNRIDSLNEDDVAVFRIKKELVECGFMGEDDSLFPDGF